MNKNQIGTALQKMQDGIVDWMDLKRELEPFAPQLAEAIEEAKKGKVAKLKKLASNLEVFRTTMMFIRAWENGDIMLMEYYGKIIRDNIMDKPKVALEHSSDGKGFAGVVVLPPVDEGDNEEG
jgi:hypothetical protein